MCILPYLRPNMESLMLITTISSIVTGLHNADLHGLKHVLTLYLQMCDFSCFSYRGTKCLDTTSLMFQLCMDYYGRKQSRMHDKVHCIVLFISWSNRS